MTFSHLQSLQEQVQNTIAVFKLHYEQKRIDWREGRVSTQERDIPELEIYTRAVAPFLQKRALARLQSASLKLKEEPIHPLALNSFYNTVLGLYDDPMVLAWANQQLASFHLQASELKNAQLFFEQAGRCLKQSDDNTAEALQVKAYHLILDRQLQEAKEPSESSAIALIDRGTNFFFDTKLEEVSNPSIFPKLLFGFGSSKVKLIKRLLGYGFLAYESFQGAKSLKNEIQETLDDARLNTLQQVINIISDSLLVGVQTFLYGKVNHFIQVGAKAKAVALLLLIRESSRSLDESVEHWVVSEELKNPFNLQRLIQDIPEVLMLVSSSALVAMRSRPAALNSGASKLSGNSSALVPSAKTLNPVSTSLVPAAAVTVSPNAAPMAQLNQTNEDGLEPDIIHAVVYRCQGKEQKQVCGPSQAALLTRVSNTFDRQGLNPLNEVLSQLASVGNLNMVESNPKPAQKKERGQKVSSGFYEVVSIEQVQVVLKEISSGDELIVRRDPVNGIQSFKIGDKFKVELGRLLNSSKIETIQILEKIFELRHATLPFESFNARQENTFYESIGQSYPLSGDWDRAIKPSVEAWIDCLRIDISAFWGEGTVKASRLYSTFASSKLVQILGNTEGKNLESFGNTLLDFLEAGSRLSLKALQNELKVLQRELPDLSSSWRVVDVRSFVDSFEKKEFRSYLIQQYPQLSSASQGALTDLVFYTCFFFNQHGKYPVKEALMLLTVQSMVLRGASPQLTQRFDRWVKNNLNDMQVKRLFLFQLAYTYLHSSSDYREGDSLTNVYLPSSLTVQDQRLHRIEVLRNRWRRFKYGSISLSNVQREILLKEIVNTVHQTRTGKPLKAGNYQAHYEYYSKLENLEGAPMFESLMMGSEAHELAVFALHHLYTDHEVQASNELASENPQIKQEKMELELARALNAELGRVIELRNESRNDSRRAALVNVSALDESIEAYLQVVTESPVDLSKIKIYSQYLRINGKDIFTEIEYSRIIRRANMRKNGEKPAELVFTEREIEELRLAEAMNLKLAEVVRLRNLGRAYLRNDRNNLYAQKLDDALRAYLGELYAISIDLTKIRDYKKDLKLNGNLILEDQEMNNIRLRAHLQSRRKK